MGRKREKDRAAARGPIVPILWLFAASGATGLIYEVLWRRLLMLVLGGSMWATAITLSAFMAGLGFGAIVVGHLADRVENPLRWYGFAEIGVGLYALVFPLLCALIRAAHDAAFPLLETRPALLRAAALFGAFAVLLPPTLLMGGTFPLLVRHYLRIRRSLERGVRDLYLFNTAGAVAGAILAGFFLIVFLGTQATGALAAAVNLAIGATALHLSGRKIEAPPEAAAPPPRPKRRKTRTKTAPAHLAESREALSPGQIRLALVVFGLSGLTALSYETLWTRIMVFVVGNSTYSFAVMLSSFLCGLALGAWLLRFVGESRPALKAAFVEALIAISAIATLAASQGLYKINRILLGEGGGKGYAALLGSRYILAMLVMLPTAALFGLAFPLLVRLCTRSEKRTGTEVGWAYGCNTFGAILGPLVAVLALIPLWGISGAVVATALLNAALAAVLLGLVPSWDVVRKFGWAAAIVGATVFLGFAAPRHLDISRRCKLAGGAKTELLYYKEGTAATVAVFRLPDNLAKVMAIDGVSQVPTDADSIEVFRLLGHLPFLVRDDVREVLVTAFGGGITLGAILTHPVERVEAVEICPDVLPAARVFREENGGAFEDRRLKVILADAFSYVRATPNLYDAIVSDATHPAAAESWVLYTREFYENCKRHLRPGGVMCQWVPLHGLAPRDFRTILHTFQSVFPNATLWFARGYSVLLATERPLELEAERIRRELADPRVGPSLKNAYLDTPAAILKNLALTQEKIARLAHDAPTATTNRSPLEFAEAHADGIACVEANCAMIAAAAEGFVPVRNLSAEEKAALSKAIEARPAYYRAVGLLSENDIAGALPLLCEAAEKLAPDTDLRLYAAGVADLLLSEVSRDPDSVAKAMERFHTLAQLFPDEPHIQISLGRTLTALARRNHDRRLLEEGLTVLNRAAARFADRVDIQLLSAQEFFRFRQFAAAQALLERAVRLEPRNALAWTNLGACRLALGRVEEARRAVEKALALNPRFPTALNLQREIEKRLARPGPTSRPR